MIAFGPFFQGLFLGLSLIVVIGAQNAYVLRLGLEKTHVLPVVLICATSDALLIFAGAAGMGRLVAQSEVFLNIALWLGLGFILFYAFLAFRRAYEGQGHLRAGQSATSLGAAVTTALALTWLNPHVYLDTVVLLGTLAQSSGAPWVYASGAAAGSFLFFFSLGFGAKALSPYVASAMLWRIIDLFIGSILLWAAWSLWTISLPVS